MLRAAVLSLLLAAPALARTAGPRHEAVLGSAETAERAAALLERARALDSDAARRRRLMLRFPTLEISALRSQLLLARPGRPLSKEERDEAYLVFKDSLDYDAVRIVHLKVRLPFLTVWGNTVRVGAGTPLPAKVLIHELAHVWQYQTAGTAYISDSLLHQAVAATQMGSVTKAYELEVRSGARLADFNAEQQAEIAANYYAWPDLRKDPDYARLISEVRSRAPLRLSRGEIEEFAAGLPRRDIEPLPLRGWEPPREGRGVPLLEIRFPGL